MTERAGVLLLACVVEERLGVWESRLCRPDLDSWTEVGGLPSGGSLLSEALLELDGEQEREEDRSRETSDLGPPSLRRKKPGRRLDEPGGECGSSAFGLREGGSLGGWSTPETER